MNQPVKPKLKPSKRPKKRYVLFEISGAQNFFHETVKRAMVFHFRNFFGQEFEKQRIWVTSFFPETGFGILRCGRTAVERVKKAVVSFKLLNGKPVKSRTVLTSGSIKKLKEKVK